MLFRKRTISMLDRDELFRALNRADSGWGLYEPHLEFLRAELRRARVVPPDQVPCDLITMNSQFVICDRQTGQTATWTLVYPIDASPAHGRISVLSPEGAALLGASVSDDVRWQTGAGPKSVTVEQVLYQPELVHACGPLNCA